MRRISMFKIVEDHRDDYVEFMKKLVSIKSWTCQEGTLAQFLLEEFQKMDVDEAFIDGAGNMVAIVRGEGKGPNIILNGHLDAVPEGNLDNWAPYDPYKPEVVDGKLIGRGIDDLKGGLAAQIFAFKAILERVVKKGKKLPGDLIFLAVVQEEPAEMFGMEYFFDYTMKEKNIKADLVYLAEPSSNDLAIGQRGKVELVVKTFGRCAHSSQPQEGINALEYMVPILQDIFSHTGIELKTDFLGSRTPITVTNCIVKPGGTLSVIPDECEISIDRRYSTEQSLDDLLNEFKAIFKRLSTSYPEFKATVEPRVYEETSYTGYKHKVKKFHPPWSTDRNNEYVVKSFKALRALGQDPAEKYWKFGTDGGTTCAIHGIPTIGYSGAEEKWAHQPKEQVDLEEMFKTYEGYVAMLAEIYGIDVSAFN
jgi:putative selenium metabolism hydrolase